MHSPYCLCRGLSALHASHIIHRDIKPANIFLCQNDLLKIGDLGVAKALNRWSVYAASIHCKCIHLDIVFVQASSKDAYCA